MERLRGGLQDVLVGNTDPDQSNDFKRRRCSENRGAKSINGFIGFIAFNLEIA